jgi:hypothetical protein
VFFEDRIDSSPLTEVGSKAASFVLHVSTVSVAGSSDATIALTSDIISDETGTDGLRRGEGLVIIDGSLELSEASEASEDGIDSITAGVSLVTTRVLTSGFPRSLLSDIFGLTTAAIGRATGTEGLELDTRVSWAATGATREEAGMWDGGVIAAPNIGETADTIGASIFPGIIKLAISGIGDVLLLVASCIRFKERLVSDIKTKR